MSGGLGHANAAAALDVYAHLLETSARQAVEVIADLLSARGSADS